MTHGKNCAVWLCVAALAAGRGGADDESVAEAAKRFEPYAEKTAASYELHTAGPMSRKLEPRAKSLLRWTNPLTGSRNHGELFLWTDRGRPAAVLSMYEYYDTTGIVHEHHEWISLALGGIEATGPRIWTPVAGIELKPVTDAPLPADTPLRRLGQMRAMAADFTAEKTARNGVVRAIQLMSQPLFRYEAGDPEVIDGALFAFVEGTDPDVFLCLEARLVKDKPSWQYGLARVVRLPVAVSYQGKKVWVADLLSVPETYDQTKKPYSVFAIK